MRGNGGTGTDCGESPVFAPVFPSKGSAKKGEASSMATSNLPTPSPCELDCCACTCTVVYTYTYITSPPLNALARMDATSIAYTIAEHEHPGVERSGRAFRWGRVTVKEGSPGAERHNVGAIGCLSSPINRQHHPQHLGIP